MTKAAASPRRIRPRFVVVVLAGLVVLVSGLGCAMFGMPGRSWTGDVPPLDEGGLAVRAEVEGDVRALAETVGERSVFLPEKLEAAARYVESRFAACGLVPRRETYVALGNEVSNVIAEVPGGSRATEIVVVGAHYDTVRGTPGANDNATGVAAMLALACRLARAEPARTIRFVAFTGEEPPCFQTQTMGSLVHARGCAARGEDVVAMMALETLGCFRDEEGSQEYPVRGMGFLYPTRGNFVSFVGDLGSRALVREAIGVFREGARIPSEGAALPMWVPGVGWSDHWSFRQTGFPAFMVTDTAIFRDHAYHTLRDTPDRVDFDRLARVTLDLLPVVRRLADPDQ